MYTNESVKAEVAYRRERLSRDFRQYRNPRTRPSIVKFFGKKA